MGAAYFPHCRFAYLNPDGCTGAEAGARGVSWLKWLLSALLTGALIGLGAPFWFDVAKRLAEVRAMFGGKSSAETRLSGNEANADPDKRRKIVAQVLADMVPETAPPARGVG